LKRRFPGQAVAAAAILGWLLPVAAPAAQPGGRSRVLKRTVSSPLSARPVARGRVTAVPRGGLARVLTAARTEQPQLLIETDSLDFGQVVAGDDAEHPGAVVARVISPGPYRLVIASRGGVVTSADQPVAGARLACRSSHTGVYRSLPAGVPVTVWSGDGTSLAGDLVVLDLRLDLTDADPTGHYIYSLDLRVEPGY